MIRENAYHLRQRPYLHWALSVSADRIDHQWQTGDVIKVRMREHHVINAQHLVDGQVAQSSAGVDEYGVAQQVAGGLASRAANAAMASKQSYRYHAVSPDRVSDRGQNSFG